MNTQKQTNIAWFIVFLAMLGRSLILMYSEKNLESFFVLCGCLGTMVIISNQFPKGLKDFLQN